METSTAGGTAPDGTESARGAEGTPAPPPAAERTPGATADGPMPTAASTDIRRSARPAQSAATEEAGVGTAARGTTQAPGASPAAPEQVAASGAGTTTDGADADESGAVDDLGAAGAGAVGTADESADAGVDTTEHAVGGAALVTVDGARTETGTVAKAARAGEADAPAIAHATLTDTPATAHATVTQALATPNATLTDTTAAPQATLTDAAAPAHSTGSRSGAAACAAGADAGSPVGRVAVAPVSLSPSRAGDFMQCPLLYRFRVIDRLPEKPSEAATRGTLVHAVLERLFDAPAAERTAPRAKALIPGQWDRLRESRPELVELFADDVDGERLARWLAEAEQLVERWFTLEDPTRLEPAERELFVETELASGLRLRGIIDRVDVAPTGEVRIVDYKTGKAPRPEYAEGALFQMKFYALVVWRLKKIVPRRLQLVYLGSGDVLTYDPVPADLERVERKLLALWEAIRLATETGDWRPRPTKLCGWCDHQAHCPEFGGTPPPYPLPLPLDRAASQVQGRMGPE